MKQSLSNLYIPDDDGEGVSFYYIRNDKLYVAYIPFSTGRVLSIGISAFRTLKKLHTTLTKGHIIYHITTATNPEEFISLHPELFI